MPISTMPSARVRTHSWDLVYLRSAGTLLMNGSSCDQGFAETHERRLHDSGVEEPAADIHLHPRGGGRGHARERYGALERRGEGAAGDLALAHARHENLLLAAQHAAILEQEADELAHRTAGADRLERLAPDEGAPGRLERHAPGEARLEGIGALVHVVAVEVHAGFEAQRVARPEAAGGDSEGVEPAPRRDRVRRRH